MRYALSPYFRSRGRAGRACPECGARAGLRGLELTWDGALWKCPRCRWFELEMAPEGARLGPREPAPPRGRIIRPDFGKTE